MRKLWLRLFATDDSGMCYGCMNPILFCKCK